MLDDSCTELGEQKHYGTTTQSQVVTKEIYSVYTRSVAYKLYYLILMNKGVLKSHISSIPEGVHSCYRDRNIPWYRSDTKMARHYNCGKGQPVASTKATCIFRKLQYSTKSILIVYNKE